MAELSLGHGISQQHPGRAAMSNRVLGEGGLRSYSFIWCFDGLRAPAVSPVTARYWVSVIICSLIVKWALMKRAGSPSGQFCYWRNGSQQWGQLLCTGTHTHTPCLSNWASWKSGHCNLWFGWGCREVGLIIFLMWWFKHSYERSNTPELLIGSSQQSLCWWWQLDICVF